MSKINYKKLYEESIFDKINLQKQFDTVNDELSKTKKLIDYNNFNYKELYDKLIVENNDLKDKLKKYTSPNRSKKYYENHKEELIKKSKEYYDKKDPEKIKEYNKRAYEKRKELKKKNTENNVENKNI